MFCAGRARQRLAANQRSRDQSEHGPKRAGAERHFIHLQSVDARRGPTNCRERPRNAVDARGFVTADHLTLSARINPKVRYYMQLQPHSEAGVGRGTAFTLQLGCGPEQTPAGSGVASATAVGPVRS